MDRSEKDDVIEVLSTVNDSLDEGTNETDKTEEQKNDDKNEVEMNARVIHPSNLVNDLTTAASTFEEKQKQLMLADCQRLKKKMNVIKNSIQRPPLKPFTPYLFNSLEPYYNQYIVNYVFNELQEDEENRPKTNYGQRATSLGIVDPQVSWRMDNVPGPFKISRLHQNICTQKKWIGTPQRDASLGSTRLPPFPKPSFPKIDIPEYSASKMDYSKVLKFRIELERKIESLNKKKIQIDYDRTIKDWERMNLNELKELPPYSRYHVGKAIKTYFGTSKGASLAVSSLSKNLVLQKNE